MKCVNCNNEINENYSFCPICGSAIVKEGNTINENKNEQSTNQSLINIIPITSENKPELSKKDKTTNTIGKILGIIFSVIGGIVLLYFIVVAIALGVCFFAIFGLAG